MYTYVTSKGDKVQDTFTPVVFNFKTKKVDLEEEMTTEIMANEV